MNKVIALVFTFAIMSAMFSGTVFAQANSVNYYDKDGNTITINGMYYNSEGIPMYNAGCYYLDGNGEPVYVGECRAYYYGEDGGLTAGNYYYDQNGSAVTPPTSYPGGWGCGMYYYDTQGEIVNQATYYDDFGNPVDPPADTRQPAYRGGRGSCCGRW